LHLRLVRDRIILSRTNLATLDVVATVEDIELARDGSRGPLGHDSKGSEPAGRGLPDLAFLFSMAAHSLQTELTARLEHLGLTPRAQCVLIKALEGEQTQIRLAERCGLDKTTMVVTVDELEKAGLAERRPSPTDRRARIIAVTEAGRKLAEEGDALVEGIYADVLESLPEDERDVFANALSRLVSERLANPPACVKPVRRPRTS
jgi:MarR family transcriptional regulator for hemolysin